LGKAVYIALEQIIKLGAGVSLDGYMICGQSDWEFRYGLDYISVLMGYSDNYYRRSDLRRTKKPGKKLEALLQKGYTGYKVPVKVLRDGKRGASIVETISFDDLCLIVEYEAEARNPKAIALLTASFRELLRSRTQAAFELPEDSLEQRQADFDAAYWERLEALQEDRLEVEALRLPGDDLYYPQYQDWVGYKDWDCG
jgi:hypothetical protein